MITLRNLHKAFGAQVIFDGAGLQVNPGDRVAVVGPNGAGKSTLFRLLLGELEVDRGEIVLQRGLRFGHLPQENADFRGRSVLEETLPPVGADGPHAAPDERVTAEAKKILMGLGFRVADFDRPVGALSGGWRMRVAIARLLLRKPDVLLLDEPTNHLDLESLLWFQERLRAWKGALLLISHDRAFVNALTDAVLDLRERRFFKYPGDYDKFVETRRREEERLVAAYERQQKEIEEHESFIARFRAQAAKAPQVQSRIKMLEKMELIELPPEVRKVKIRFPQPARAGARVLALKGVSKSYGPVKVYEKLDFELERGQKMVFVGHNGAGKSTLLKILAGVVPLDGGERVLGLNARVGYYAQHRVEMLQPGRTVWQEATDSKRLTPDLLVRTILGTFLFSGDAVEKKVSVLSGGEKSRLALVKLLLDPPNVLLLDEPTTHLDMASVEALVDALRDYEGTLCFISHDLYFINTLADHVLHVEAGKLTLYPGNYEYFQRRLAQKDAGEDAPAPVFREARPKPTTLPPVKSTAAEVRRLRDTHRRRDKDRRKLNARIRDLEEELADLNARMGSVFLKSDYKKLMELDAAVKTVEKDLAAARTALAKTDDLLTGPAADPRARSKP